MYESAVKNNVVEIQSSQKAWSVEANSAAHVSSFEPFVDDHTVALHLLITPRRVLEMARKGEIPAHPLGNQRKTWRFRMSEIDSHFSTRSEKRPSASITLAVPGTQERKRLG